MSLIQRSLPRQALHASSVARAGGGMHPGWSIPEANYHKYTYQPTIPDKHYNIGHYNYAPITLWLRARRPSMERVIYAMADTAKYAYGVTVSPLLGMWDSFLPGFGLKCIGFLGLLLGYNVFVALVLNRTEQYMLLEKLSVYETSKRLFDSGFFVSESEDNEARMQQYNMKSMELEELWETSLAEATQVREFSKFVEKLRPEECNPDPLQDPVAWRFNMMPYGRGHPDVSTFPSNGIDDPKSSLFFWGDIGSTGDYIERKDNKMGIMKKARHLYTSAYLPPTK